jgi:hypothetical protein
MKPHIFFMLAAIFALSFLAGCETTDEAAATVPWDAPASFEGAGVGLPTINEGGQ